MRLSGGEREALLRLARRAIEDAVRRERALGALVAATRITPALRERRGIFVTLKQPADDPRGAGERLRGCVGRLESERALIDEVVQVAQAAALEDPRFPPLAVDELPAVRVSISVLSPPEPASAEAIVIGRHGVQLVRGARKSVFLPQVALEQGWSVEQLLAQLAIKAGLPAGAWRDAALSTFEAEAFGEHPRRGLA